MKRHTITAAMFAILVAVILCACNLDATDGIYSEVASSTESKDVIIRSYLGKYSGEYYYLADDGIYINGKHEALVTNSDSLLLRGASLDEATGTLLVLAKDRTSLKSQLYECTAATDYALGEPINGGTSYTGLLINGIYFNDSGIYYGSTPSVISLDDNTAVNNVLETEDYAFFSVFNKETRAYTFYVVKNDDSFTPIELEGSSTLYVGFQPLSDSKFIMVSYDSTTSQFNGYLLQASGIGDKLFKFNSSIPYAYSTQAASFAYTYNARTYMVIKCNSYFDIVDVTDTDATEFTITSLSTGFASDLRTTEISNIRKDDGTNKFVAGTYNSLLYLIDMDKEDVTSTTATQL